MPVAYRRVATWPTAVAARLDDLSGQPRAIRATRSRSGSRPLRWDMPTLLAGDSLGAGSRHRPRLAEARP
jgi:hypothetical protein